MDSPYVPSYGRGGPQPADDITHLVRHAPMENLRELQKYSEKLQFEATCCRLWSEGIQDQIMDEQERVQPWIAGMTDELIRLKRVEPAWVHQLQNQGGPAAPPTSMMSTFQSAAASLIQLSFYCPGQASPYVKEHLNGVCSTECSISSSNGCRSMG